MEEVDLEVVAAVADGRTIMSPSVLRYRAAAGLGRLLVKKMDLGRLLIKKMDLGRLLIKMGFEMTAWRRGGSGGGGGGRNVARGLTQHEHLIQRHLPLEYTDS